MKIRLPLLFFAFALALFGGAFVRAQSKDTAVIDLTGKWSFTVQTAQGPGSPSFTFEQKGEDLRGTYTGFFGTAPLTGKVREGKVTFTVKINADGQEINMVYSGEVTAAAMKGKIDFGGYGEGTFEGKRAP